MSFLFLDLAGDVTFFDFTLLLSFLLVLYLILYPAAPDAFFHLTRAFFILPSPSTWLTLSIFRLGLINHEILSNFATWLAKSVDIRQLITPNFYHVRVWGRNKGIYLLIYGMF